MSGSEAGRCKEPPSPTKGAGGRGAPGAGLGPPLSTCPSQGGLLAFLRRPGSQGSAGSRSPVACNLWELGQQLGWRGRSPGELVVRLPGRPRAGLFHGNSWASSQPGSHFKKTERLVPRPSEPRGPHWQGWDHPAHLSPIPEALRGQGVVSRRPQTLHSRHSGRFLARRTGTTVAVMGSLAVVGLNETE